LREKFLVALQKIWNYPIWRDIKQLQLLREFIQSSINYIILSVTICRMELQGWAAKLTQLASHADKAIKYFETNGSPLLYGQKN
jgi:hypothetical protein